jgi:predicted Zn finger-like uncharacterized protein
MYAQCPECLAIYKLGAAPLAAARGRVRCGSCASEFDALATLVDELPSEAIAELPVHRPGMPPQLAVPALRPQAQQRELFVRFDAPAGAAPARGAARPDPTLRADRASAPSFARRARTTRAPAGGAGWWAGVVLLALVLAAQWAWLERARLLADPAVMRRAEALCARLGCTVPAVRAPARIALLARDVRPHPSVPNALVISATLANQAPFAQPYPAIAITLADPNEQRIAMRRFAAHEYVADGAALARGLAPGASAAVSFEVEDPGKNAVAFEFEFL